jgi:cytochrome c biogenesis protein CcdA/thiol-disulfide isomerase/thioredoxin
MYPTSINITLAFLEGFALIISPCILPVLPIVLSGSLTGNKARPLGIISGFVLSFTVLTLFSRFLIHYTNINVVVLRNLAFAILVILGCVMISTSLTEKFAQLTQRLTNVGSSLTTVNDGQSGFFGGLLFGSLIGVVWTPCAGPILAAVIVQVVLQQTSISSLLTVLAFAIGAGLPMIFIALLGRSVLNKFQVFRTKTILLRKLLGVIIILSVGFLMFDTSTLTFAQPSSATTASTLINGIARPYQAPALQGLDPWINSQPLQLTELRGKVVLIDFWTYSCINCLRTLPYLKNWYANYHDKGLVIIGIHAPEFEFERNADNVKNAVNELGIHYPVALDNQFSTWRNFNNRYWPAHYLINKNGEVVYEHFGEGEYDVTENNIRYLLGLTGTINKTATETSSYAETPETYFGYLRANSYASPEAINQGRAGTYTYPAILAQDNWALKGEWKIAGEKIVALKAGAAIKLHFYAKNVYAVMGNTGIPVKVRLALNGEAVVLEKGGAVINSNVLVKNNKLYYLLAFPQEKEGIVELTALSPGLEIYTFTFGAGL